MLGSLLLATHGPWARYGWLAYLAANLTMGTFASAIGAYGLLAQQVGFTATTLFGLHRAGLLRGRSSARGSEGLSWMGEPAPTEGADEGERARARR
jgi:hypothetical protein